LSKIPSHTKCVSWPTDQFKIIQNVIRERRKHQIDQR
jgi:hypothetical protein